MKKVCVSAVVIVVVTYGITQFVFISPATAQSGSRSRDAGGRSRNHAESPAPRQQFENRFWKWLHDVKYENWAPWPGRSADPYEGQSPHGAFLKMYVNRAAAANPTAPPHGSVIIKENYGKDRKTLMAVTVMYRIKDYHPQAGDWYWVKYNPNGRVAMKGNMRLAGKLKGCIECHNGADGDDFLFAND